MTTTSTPRTVLVTGGASGLGAALVAGFSARGDRVLAPDLARGMMLLLIALAHVPWFLYDAPGGTALLHPTEGGVADRIAQALTIIVVDARTHTMFAFLFAYGIGQMYARQRARGTGEREARAILRRRHLWLLVFGAVHAALLWQGDILGTYGLLGLIMLPLFFDRGDRTLKVWVAVLLALGAGVRKTPAMLTWRSRITSVTFASIPGWFGTSTSTQLPIPSAPTSSIRVRIMSEEVMIPTSSPSATTGRQPILRS
jgi:uncharacterized membrane protein YeiB